MKVLIDTCIIIDVLQDRKPFSEDGQNIFLLAAKNLFIGYISAKSVTDIYYLIHKSTHNNDITKEILNKLLKLFDIIDTKGIDCKKALLSSTSDYEDAVMIESAERSEIDCIITRNEKDYSKSPVKVYTPKQFLNEISKSLSS